MAMLLLMVVAVRVREVMMTRMRRLMIHDTSMGVPFLGSVGALVGVRVGDIVTGIGAHRLGGPFWFCMGSAPSWEEGVLRF